MTERTIVALYQAHRDWLRRLARRFTRDAHAADDLLQETWFAVWRGEARTEVSRAWLATVLRHHLLDRQRAERRRSLREEALGPEMVSPPEPDEEAAKSEAQRWIAARWEELPEPTRRLLFLRFVEERTAGEIGRELGMPAGTVRWRLKSALDTLRGQRVPAVIPLVTPGWLARGGGWLSRWGGPSVAGSVGAAIAAFLVAIPATPPAPRVAPRPLAGPISGAPAAPPTNVQAPPPPPRAPVVSIRKKPSAATAVPDRAISAPAPPTTRYDFEADEVDGDLQRPEAELLTVPTQVREPSLLEIRRDFLPEMMKTLEQI